MSFVADLEAVIRTALADALEEHDRRRTVRQRERESAEATEALSLRQVDALLAVRKGTTAQLIKRGKLVAISVAGRRRVARAELDRYLAVRAAAPAPKRQRRKSAIGAILAAEIRKLK